MHSQVIILARTKLADEILSRPGNSILNTNKDWHGRSATQKYELSLLFNFKFSTYLFSNL